MRKVIYNRFRNAKVANVHDMHYSATYNGSQVLTTLYAVFVL